MLENFFQLGPIPTNHMSGWYDGRLVILSYLVAVFASYIALDITGRLRDISNTQLSCNLWVMGGALAMGAGIWSMHFIGMLAFNMPMPMSYDVSWTALSMVVAVGASWFALFLLRPRDIHLSNIIFGGIILGLAIAAMHYTGMAGMEYMQIRYLPGLFSLSIVIAIFASEAALWLALKSTEVVLKERFRLKVVSAFIMGAAICGMHYTGMAAAIFIPEQHDMNVMGDINPTVLAISVATVTFVILGIAFVVSTYKESLNQQLLLTARQAGMAEVASSVLHNVGNVLNSINVSAMLLNEKIKSSQLRRIEDLNQLFKSNKQLLAQDEKAQQIPNFIESLASYWHEEQKTLLNELQTLHKNVDHVKSIIATQQDLSRVSEFEQVISIPNVVEEAILITGIENPKHDFVVTKAFARLKPVLIDKVKLLQILVNLFQNGKESLIEATTTEKMLNVSVQSENKFVVITVSDNGVGIASENLTRIFAYGFTTKKSGHGFGLHTSAISAKEMGGSLTAVSKGLGSGATFILRIPYKAN